jgi:hypothetical protein
MGATTTMGATDCTLTVESVSYGKNDGVNLIDITKQVRSMVENNELHINLDGDGYSSIFTDPAPGLEKTLYITYSYQYGLINSPSITISKGEYEPLNITCPPSTLTSSSTIPSTTPSAINTTMGATTSTMGATTTTMGATTTTMGATTTTMGDTTTTMAGGIMPTFPQIPTANPDMITNLLNNGIGIDYLTSQGMSMNGTYRGPSTNIVQTNFSGTSNVYSPFLYYNKGNTESFLDKNNYSFI